MCPPSFSNMSSSSCMSDVFRNYRLSTADKSQVCDGRNLDDLRMYMSAKPPKNSTSEDIKPKRGARKTDYSYRPTSSRSNRSKAEQRTTQQPQQPPPPPAKPKTKSFLPSPFPSDSDHTLDDSYQMGELPISQEDNHKKLLVNERRPSLPLKQKQESRDTSSTESAAQQRRNSDSSNSSRSRVTMRKLSEPMHRCSFTNASVSGIMRPARYSSNNLAAMTDARMSPDRKKTTQRSSTLIRKSSSTTDFSQHSLSKLSLSRNRTSSSNLSDLKKSSESSLSHSRSSADLLRRPSRRTMSVADMANATWSNSTPTNQSSVAFSKSMEVYVFKK